MRLVGSARERKACSEPIYRLAIQAAKVLNKDALISIEKLVLLLLELLYGEACVECNRMSAVPQGAFAVCQVRKRLGSSFNAKEEEEDKDNKGSGFGAKVLQEGREPTPLKYNSKLMNSIWGLYNRYSVHNFKKIDANDSSSLLAGALDAFRPEARRTVGDNSPARVYGAASH